MVLGITGSIGSGKSTAADILTKEYGFIPIGTDELAKKIMNENDLCRRLLTGAFGPEIYGPEGKIDKERYKKAIFSSDRNRNVSDSIVHPLVWEAVKEIIDGGPEKDYLVETAVPGDAFCDICDKILLVHAEKETRVERLMKNRGYSREYAESVISGQKSEDELKSIADVVIDNSEGQEELRENIRKAVETL
ncbi:MAG: dephospho-CoA kinase [Eubacteriales bacterium]|nr:dephospho-CoA kinase [Eubacteriales bacterium]